MFALRVSLSSYLLLLLIIFQLISLWKIDSFHTSSFPHLSPFRSFHNNNPPSPTSLHVLTTDNVQRSNTTPYLHRQQRRAWMKPFDQPKIDLLYDSECPLCSMEVEFLKKRDIYQRIRFTDISAPDYDPEQHGNVAYEDGMKKLRAVLPDRRVITGVEVFRHTYEAIGLGWVFAMTRLPFIGELADTLYDFWAENRLRITGRHDLAEKLKAKAEELRNYEPDECDGTCDLEDDD